MDPANVEILMASGRGQIVPEISIKVSCCWLLSSMAQSDQMRVVRKESVSAPCTDESDESEKYDSKLLACVDGFNP